MVDENAPRRDWPLPPGESRREVWYLLVSAPDRPFALWLRYTLLSTDGGHREARVWAATTEPASSPSTRFVTNSTSLDAVHAGTEPFELAVGDVGRLTSGGAEGRVADGDTTVAWDLAYEPDSHTFRPLASRRLTAVLDRLLATGRHWSRNQSLSIDGTVTVDGTTVELEGAPGHQGHTVGGGAAGSWRWVHCNAFEERDACLEALSVGGRLAVSLRAGGRTVALNRVRDLVGPWANRTDRDEVGAWQFRAEGRGVDLVATVEVNDDWHRVAALLPDGTRRYNAHCSLAAVTLSDGTDDGESTTLESDAGRVEWVDTEPPLAGRYLPDWTSIAGE